MIQSMEILQLPLQQLEARIDQEVNENPLLEKLDTDTSGPEEPVEKDDPNAPEESEKELVVDESSNNEDDFERLLELDRQVPDHFDEAPRKSADRIQQEASQRHDTLANIATRQTTLQDELELQLRELELPDDVTSFALRIISTLDSNGYLMASVEDLLPPNAIDDDLKIAYAALDAVQALEPAGVGARDLRECLLLQLEPTMPRFEELKTLISNHLDDLKENRMPAIQRKTGYSLAQIQETWTELRKLDPKPGAIYQQTIAPTVTPDVFLDEDENGKFIVLMDEGRTPQLRISNYYRKRLMSKDATSEEREFIKRKVNAAQWLIEAIEQRKNTVKRVAQAIVDRQERFLREGPEFIEPLKMQQIADTVGVHVTTVSRAVDEKYIQAPRGIYPLRDFFVGGTTSAEGDEIAWDAIRIKLQEVVDGEDKSKPFSDEALMEELAQHGLTVARRTVTKYRKKMGIPSSRQRRDWSKVSQ